MLIIKGNLGFLKFDPDIGDIPQYFLLQDPVNGERIWMRFKKQKPLAVCWLCPRQLPQDLFHGFPPGQLIHQLIQITDLPHQRLFDLLHPYTAYNALDLISGRIGGGSVPEKIAIRKLRIQGRFKLCPCITG